MDAQTGDKTLPTSGVTDLENDPAMDQLAEILQKLHVDRVEAFLEWLETTEHEEDEQK